MQQMIVDIIQEHCLLIQQRLFLWYHLAIQFPLLCFSSIIYVSLSSKTKQSNTQNLCLSPLMLETFTFPLFNSFLHKSLNREQLDVEFMSVTLSYYNLHLPWSTRIIFYG
jgi:hypothetical protein